MTGFWASRRFRMIRATLIALQVALMLVAAIAPAGALALEPVASESPVVTSEPSVSPDPSVAPDPTESATTPDPTSEPTAAPADPTPDATAAPDPAPSSEPATTAPTADPTAAPAFAPDGPPSITSDKPDYAPGELVTLTGANWYPGEVVHIYVNDDWGSSWNRNVDVTADGAGAITDQFNLPNWFVATYSVTATGPTSGLALSSFTDSNLKLGIGPNGVSGQHAFAWVLRPNTTYGGQPVRSGTTPAD